MIGSSIAIRYSAQRPQFGDKLIMDYLSHQRRLLPGLAATYAMHLGLKQLKVGWASKCASAVCSTSCWGLRV
jgi:acyl-CoA oxidase